MDVRDGLDRQLVECLRGVLAPVDVVGVEVRHVDEEPDAGAVDEVVEELPLGHLLARPVDEGRDVLQGERHGQRVLGDADVLAQHVQGVPGARHRQQMPGLQLRRRGEGAPRPDERDVLRDEGAPSASTRSARERRRCSSGRSAPPRPRETPCGTTVTPARAAAAATRRCGRDRRSRRRPRPSRHRPPTRPCARRRRRSPAASRSPSPTVRSAPSSPPRSRRPRPHQDCVSSSRVSLRRTCVPA